MLSRADLDKVSSGWAYVIRADLDKVSSGSEYIVRSGSSLNMSSGLI